jgi:hypothetical protein
MFLLQAGFLEFGTALRSYSIQARPSFFIALHQ